MQFHTYNLASLFRETSDYNNSSDLSGAFSMPQANPVSLVLGHSKSFGIAVMALSWCDSGDATLAITPPAGYTIVHQVQDSSVTGLGGMVAYKSVTTPGEHGGFFTVGETGTTNRAWVQGGCLLLTQSVSNNGFTKR
jgi:hypothetical protein